MMISKGVFIVVSTMLLNSGCVVKSTTSKTSMLSELKTSLDDYQPKTFVSEKARIAEQKLEILAQRTAQPTAIIDLGFGHNWCGFMYLDPLSEPHWYDSASSVWQLSAWHSYQSYQPIQHIQQNTNTSTRTVVFTLSTGH